MYYLSPKYSTMLKIHKMTDEAFLDIWKWQLSKQLEWVEYLDCQPDFAPSV